jgi:flagellar motor switch/type III secretory pathway protein FliN
MNSVSAVDLGKRIIELLGVKEGDVLELSKLRDGSVRLRRAER